jgi:phage repressor protein C with HTH and peptisase S24 domain
MNTLANRINAVRLELGLSKSDVWKGAGLSSGAYTHWMNGGALKGENLIKVASILHVSPIWLETGKGPREPLSQLQNLPGYMPVNVDKLATVPVVGKSMGGLPDRLFTDEGRTVEGYDEFAEVFSTDPSAFVVRVDGNSMYPKYAQGDYALVEPGTDPELEDDIILKLDTGEVMLKRLLSRRGGIQLGSYNDQTTYLYQKEQIVWMYYVAHPIPSRKIKSRL